MNSNEVKIEKLNEKVEPQADTHADCTRGKWVGSNQAWFEYKQDQHNGPSGCNFQTYWAVF